jgi:cytochrome c oxidase cbb3-type subunit 3
MTARCRVALSVISFVAFVYLAGCDRMPGKPPEAERWRPSTQIVSFATLYAQRCSACHGADGRLGAARPLNDPLYLALVSDEMLRAVIANGIPNTSMPAFAQENGGSLTDRQIEILVEGMRAQWARPGEFTNVVLPPYSLHDAFAAGSGPGQVQNGAVVYTTYCARCHGVDGTGGPQGGSIVDSAYLALVSDQTLRTAVIAGRVDLGKPDWRANIPDRPLSPQDISDVVAWLAAQRERQPSAQRR